MASFRFESSTARLCPRQALTVLVAVASLGATGCVSASLATSTGARPEGFAWSPDPEQYVHVGEDVKFDFVLMTPFGRFLDPVGIIDYGVADFDGERIELELEPSGHLTFERTVTAPVGSRLDVTVTGYRQLSGRDQIKVGSEWIRSASPFEQPDKKVATDSVALLVYQAEVRLRLPSPPAALDPETGVMTLSSDRGSPVSVYIDRPGRPGFRITGPDADAYYSVTYDPPGNMLNDHGTTRVSFTIHDLSGQRHTISDEIATP